MRALASMWLDCGPVWEWELYLAHRRYAVGTDHWTLLLLANYYRTHLFLLWLLMALPKAKDKELNRWKYWLYVVKLISFKYLPDGEVWKHSVLHSQVHLEDKNKNRTLRRRAGAEVILLSLPKGQFCSVLSSQTQRRALGKGTDFLGVLSELLFFFLKLTSSPRPPPTSLVVLFTN